MMTALAMPAFAEAAVGGITNVSDRQELASCRYAAEKASAYKRPRYTDACRSAASVERQASGVTAMSSTAVSYENPVYGASFPDPGALRDSATDYYAYATGSGFPIIKSPDLVHWEQIGQALSSRPSWVVQSGDSHPWAPSVLRSPKSCPGTTSPGCYFMYYVGLSAQHTPATHCIGVAWSLTPAGPFTDLGPIQADDGHTDLAGRPPGCGDAGGYSNIDAAPFVDGDGSVYLYLSTGRRCAQPTTGTCPYEPVISVLALTDTPIRSQGDRKPLLGATPNSWEQEPGHEATVENPWMEKRGETYYLFYSGGDYRASYGMGYATASTPTGGTAYSAFTKSPLNPVLRETTAVLSPRGGSVTIGPDGGSWLVYHGRAGDYTQPRTMRIDPLHWSGSSVSTPGPTTGPQSFPAADTSAPETTIDSGPPDTTASTAAQFSFASSETPSTFECKLDSGAFGPCLSPKDYAALSDGQHTFEVRATDAAGNPDPTPASRSWTVAVTAPTSSPTAQPAANPLILPAVGQLPDTTLDGVAVKVRSPAHLGRVLRRGLLVRLICGEPCVATLRLWLAPRVANQLGLDIVDVGRSRARLGAPGSIRVRVRCIRTAQAPVAARRAVRIALQATIKDVAGNRREFSHPVTLRRGAVSGPLRRLPAWRSATPASSG
jgi:beta-xylosidase